MGIAPYKTFTFDGESSADYDVYLTGVGVFDSPERDVEMIEILGRNGNFALDRGRFRNVSVKYKIGMYDLNEANFATKVSAFRNWLCSKVGYVRLSDDYNPNEYRMAVYASGFELKHEFLIAGEAEITFDCKPQRWLTSGETATAVTSGGTLTNPTLFEASPLLEVYGYGGIAIGNSEEIIIATNPQIGNIQIAEGFLDSSPNNTQTVIVSQSLDVSALNTGDYISVYEKTGLSIRMEVLPVNLPASNLVVTTSGDVTLLGSKLINNQTIVIVLEIPPQINAFQKGTSGSIVVTCTFSWTDGGGAHSCTITETIAYDGNATITYTRSFSDVSNITEYHNNTNVGIIMANSTKTALGNPMYIDLDIGEAWNEDYGEPVSVNNAVSLGSELPKLPTGTTTITYDNTITSLKVAPRWWQV